MSDLTEQLEQQVLELAELFVDTDNPLEDFTSAVRKLETEWEEELYKQACVRDWFSKDVHERIFNVAWSRISSGYLAVENTYLYLAEAIYATKWDNIPQAN